MFTRFTSFTFTLFLLNFSVVFAEDCSNLLMRTMSDGPKIEKVFKKNEHGSGFVKFILNKTEKGKYSMNFVDGKDQVYHAYAVREFIDEYKGVALSELKRIDDEAIFEADSLVYGILKYSPSDDPSIKIIINAQPIISKKKLKHWATTIRRELELPEDYFLNLYNLNLGKNVSKKFLRKENLAILKNTTSSLYGDVANSGIAIGKLVNLRGTELFDAFYRNQIGPNDIAIVDRLGTSIPPVKGIISTIPVSEHSHAAILSKAMGIPIGTIDFDKNLEKMVGDEIILMMQKKSVRIKQTSKFEKSTVEKIKKLTTIPKPKKISFNLPERRIINFDVIDEVNLNEMGIKGRNLLFLTRNFKKNTEPFQSVINPGYYKLFLDHVEKSNGIDIKKIISRLEKRWANNDIDPREISFELLELRRIILGSKFPKVMKKEVSEYLQNNYSNNSDLIFRSIGTGAIMEDQGSFNSAGLFDSVIHSVKDWDDGVKKVMASVFNERAFFHMNSADASLSDVYMSVGIAPAHQNIISNGVAINKRTLYNYESVELMASNGQFSVVDEMNVNRLENVKTVYTSQPITHVSQYFDKRGWDISSLNYLEYEEYQDLSKLICKVSKRYRAVNKIKPDIDLDIEWAAVEGPRGERNFLIDQIREIPGQTGKREFIVLPENKTYSLRHSRSYGWPDSLTVDVPIKISYKFASHLDDKNLKKMKIKTLSLTFQDGKEEVYENVPLQFIKRSDTNDQIDIHMKAIINKDDIDYNIGYWYSIKKNENGVSIDYESSPMFDITPHRSISGKSHIRFDLIGMDDVMHLNSKPFKSKLDSNFNLVIEDIRYVNIRGTRYYEFSGIKICNKKTKKCFTSDKLLITHCATHHNRGDKFTIGIPKDVKSKIGYHKNGTQYIDLIL